MSIRIEPEERSWGIRIIPKGTSLKGSSWKLACDLVTEVVMAGSAIVAIDHSIDEYGIGDTWNAAVEDLLTSLADYRVFLEEREGKLAEKPRRELGALRALLEDEHV